MLRVGLTGGLGSGKSTVAEMLRVRGAHVIEADTVGRELMQPGQEVFQRIVETFGPGVLRADGALDRGKLAQIAFAEGRGGELNAIVHPAVIAEQERRMEELFAREPAAIAVIESALIFEAERAGTVPEWRRRFDRLILVTAPDEIKIARYVARVSPPGSDPERQKAAERDARSRLAVQIPDAEKRADCDDVIENAGSREELEVQVERIFPELVAAARV